MPPTMWRSVRLIEIPDAAPPYDCETHGAACPVTREQVGQGGSRDEVVPICLPGLTGGAAARASAAPDLTGGAAAWSSGSPGRTGAAAATAAAAVWPRQFAQVMVEILAGVRPQRQIDALTTDRVRARIRHLGPVLAADRRPRIQRVVTSRPADGVVEMTVVVSFGPRSRALAMRLEYVAAREAAPGLPSRPARWLCTELETG
jgi:hypothetical protein